MDIQPKSTALGDGDRRRTAAIREALRVGDWPRAGQIARALLETHDDIAMRAAIARAARQSLGCSPLRVTIAGFGNHIVLADALTAYAAADGIAVETENVLGLPSTPARPGQAALHLIAVQTPEALAGLEARLATYPLGSILLVPHPALSVSKQLPSNVETLDTPSILAQVSVWQDLRRLGDQGVMPRPAAAIARAAMAHLRGLVGATVKLIVTDLDGTLWGGMLGENGPGGLSMTERTGGGSFAAYQRRLRELARRGVLLAVASHNHRDDVAAVLSSHPDLILSPTDFVAVEASWRPKSQIVAELLDLLGVAPERAAFLDDDPLQRALMADALPQVLVPGDAATPDLCLVRLEAEGRLTSSASSEDRVRAQSTRASLALAERVTRTPDRQAALAALGMRIAFECLSANNLARARQLAERVSQFRTTSLAAIEAPCAGGDRHTFLARLTDTDADHGRVGLIVWRRSGEAGVVDLLCLSCRALNRDVETALLSEAMHRAGAAGLSRLEAGVENLPRNEPARDVYARHGFAEYGPGRFFRDLRHGAIALPTHLTLVPDDRR